MTVPSPAYLSPLRRRLLAVLALAPLALAVEAPAAAVSRYDRGLLWRISRRGLPPSWLFGTLHRADPRLLPLAPAVESAFSGSRRLLIELLPDDGVAARFGEAVQGQPGQPGEPDSRLDRHVSPATLAALRARWPGPAEQAATVGGLKPWAALLMLTALPPDPAAADVNALDNELFIRARYANKRVEGLDSVEEQIAVFDDIPLASQLALLEAALEFHDLLPQLAEQTIEAWLARDLRRLDALGRVFESRRPALAPHQRVLEKKVVRDRSVVMAYRMQPHLRRGQSFVAVGASHLYGEHGLPALLVREYGWRVDRVW